MMNLGLKWPPNLARVVTSVLFVVSFGLPVAVEAQVSVSPQEHGPQQQEFVHGAPQVPSLEWTLAAGGRIYDNWWEALDRDEPEGTNPAYPASAKQEGAEPGGARNVTAGTTWAPKGSIARAAISPASRASWGRGACRPRR